jgi:hypothetical protein
MTKTERRRLKTLLADMAEAGAIIERYGWEISVSGWRDEWVLKWTERNRGDLLKVLKDQRPKPRRQVEALPYRTEPVAGRLFGPAEAMRDMLAA